MSRREYMIMKQGKSLRRLLRNTELQLRDYERQCSELIVWKNGWTDIKYKRPTYECRIKRF